MMALVASIRQIGVAHVRVVGVPFRAGLCTPDEEGRSTMRKAIAQYNKMNDNKSKTDYSLYQFRGIAKKIHRRSDLQGDGVHLTPSASKCLDRIIDTIY